jgi:predicted dehydrogenase
LEYRDVLADPTVEAVVISTPPYLHAEQLEAALEAGKHVLLEKPIAESTGSVRRIVKAVEEAQNQIVLEASCRHTRLTRKFQFIKSIIDSGKLGEVYHIHHNHLMRTTFIEYNPHGAWAMNRKLAAGGPFADWGVYDLSFHLGLFSDVPQLKSLRSFNRNDLRDMSKFVEFSDVEQHGAAWLEFDTGLTYYYERGAGVHAQTPNETRLYGTEGGLRFQFPTWDSNDVEFFTLENGEPQREVLTVDMAGAPDDSHAITTHFLDCLDGKAEPLMTVQLAAKHMDILFRILEA